MWRVCPNTRLLDMTFDQTQFDRVVLPPPQPGGQFRFLGAIAAAMLMHAALALALIDRMERQLAETAEETPVLVQLVPPPEPEEPEPETAETPEPEPPPEPQDQPPVEGRLAAAPPIPVLRPVIEFGETDSGSRVDTEGAAARDPEETADDGPEEPEQAEAQEEPRASTEIIAILSDQADQSAAQQTPDLVPMTQARQLYSETMLNEPNVRTAMQGMPRSERAKLLCATELRAQLRAADRAVDMLPQYPLESGTEMEHLQAAFRAQGQWFDLAFRCEVDDIVTKVLNFSYQIGDAIPRAQWAQRGFPDF